MYYVVDIPCKADKPVSGPEAKSLNTVEDVYNFKVNYACK